MVEQWDDAHNPRDDETASQYKARRLETQSVFSYKSTTSKASYKSRVDAEKKKNADTMSQWNDSTVSKRQDFSAEDKIASKIASEILKDNHKLKGIHSGASIKKILEKEAKKQLMAQSKENIGKTAIQVMNESTYKGPMVTKHVLREKIDPNDPHNLPYLHKHPGI